MCAPRSVRVPDHQLIGEHLLAGTDADTIGEIGQPRAQRATRVDDALGSIGGATGEDHQRFVVQVGLLVGYTRPDGIAEETLRQGQAATGYAGQPRAGIEVPGIREESR